MRQFYRHSGIVPLSGALFTAIAGTGTAIVVAVVFAFLINLTPSPRHEYGASELRIFRYLTTRYLTSGNPVVEKENTRHEWSPSLFHLGLLAGSGFAIGLVVQNRALACNIRNGAGAAIIALMCGIVALYFVWAADLLFRSGAIARGDYLGAFHSSVLSQHIGWFGVVEALMMSGIPTMMVAAGLRDTVFCEHCSKWNNLETDVVRLTALPMLDISQLAKSENLDALCNAPRAEATASDFLQVGLSSCAACAVTNTLWIESVTVETTKRILFDRLSFVPGLSVIFPKTVRSESTKRLIDRLLITKNEVEAIRRIGNSVDNIPESAETGRNSSPRKTSLTPIVAAGDSQFRRSDLSGRTRRVPPKDD